MGKRKQGKDKTKLLLSHNEVDRFIKEAIDSFKKKQESHMDLHLYFSFGRFPEDLKKG